MHFVTMNIDIFIVTILVLFSVYVTIFSIFLMYCWQIKLGVPGWKERYYEEKFEAKSSEELEEIRRDVVRIQTH